jgi:hypothetical protein
MLPRDGIVDLSQLRHTPFNDEQQKFLDGMEKVACVKVEPGDRMLLILPPQATTQDVQGFSHFLGDKFPGVQWVVVAGPLGLMQLKEPQGGTDSLPE